MSAYNAISRFSASFNPRNFVTIVTASLGSTNTTDFTSYSNFSDEDDFFTKMNTLYSTHGGGTSSSATTLTGTNYDIRWTDTTTDTNGGHWTKPIRPASTFSQSITSGSLYDNGLVPFVNDLISKIQSATTNSGTVTYNGVTASPYYVWNNTTSNVANLNMTNFNKLSIRMRVYSTQLDIQIIAWISDSDPWGYWEQSITKSGDNWTGAMISSSSSIDRHIVPVPDIFLTSYAQFTN